MAITLYHDWDSVCSFKVRMCLAEKEIAWHSSRVDLIKFENLAPVYLELNPNGVVPTLVDDGLAIIESSVINEYLEDRFPARRLAPLGAAERAMMRIWVKYQDDVLYPAQRPATFQLMVRRKLTSLPQEEIAALVAHHPQPERARHFLSWASGEPDPAVVEEARRKLAQILARLERRLGASPWLAGVDYSLAEVAFAPFIDRLERLDLAELWSGMPAVADWMARVKARPAFALAKSPPQFEMPGPRRSPEPSATVRGNSQ
jgi:glutathione S-transferase